jgi:hypothetical protein
MAQTLSSVLSLQVTDLRDSLVPYPDRQVIFSMLSNSVESFRLPSIHDDVGPDIRDDKVVS